MEIDFYDPRQMLSHFLLGEKEVAQAVSETNEFQKDRKITATVFMNGVEVPAETFERVLHDFWAQVERNFEEKYKDAQKAAHDAAIKILEEQASGVLEKMQELNDTLEDANCLIKPFWEK